MTCKCDLKGSVRNTAMYGQAPLAGTLCTVIFVLDRTMSEVEWAFLKRQILKRRNKHLPLIQNRNTVILDTKRSPLETNTQSFRLSQIITLWQQSYMFRSTTEPSSGCQKPFF